MATPKQTLEQFLRDNAAFIDSNGNVISPEAGGNYLASGQSAVDYYNRNIGQQYAGSGWDGNVTDNPLPFQDYLSLAWQPGVEDTGGVLGSALSGFGKIAEGVAKPALTGAAMYYGLNGLNGLLGGASGSNMAAMGIDQVAAAEPLIGAAVDQTAAETARLAAMNAGTNTLGGIGASTLGVGGGAMSYLNDAVKFMKENAGVTQLAGALGGALASKDTTTSSSQSKDPWGPAQPYLKDNLATNANMQEYYRANPFSTEQKTAYQGLLNTLANNQMNAQGLLANASNFGKSSGGKMPAMTGLLSGTQAPIIDWSQYANIGRK